MKKLSQGKHEVEELQLPFSLVMSISVKLIRRGTNVLLTSTGKRNALLRQPIFAQAVVAMLQPVGHSRHVLLASTWPLTAMQS